MSRQLVVGNTIHNHREILHLEWKYSCNIMQCRESKNSDFYFFSLDLYHRLATQSERIAESSYSKTDNKPPLDLSFCEICTVETNSQSLIRMNVVDTMFCCIANHLQQFLDVSYGCRHQDQHQQVSVSVIQICVFLMLEQLQVLSCKAIRAVPPSGSFCGSYSSRSGSDLTQAQQ